MGTIEKKLLNVSEVAKMIGTNPNYVYRLISCGLLPCLKLGSKKVRIQALEAFLAEYEGKDVDAILEGSESNDKWRLDQTNE